MSLLQTRAMANAKHQPPLEMAPHAVRAHIASLRSVPGERQLTSAPHGHILTNVGVWSPDGEWIVYDTRSDPAGASFDGRTIEMVHTFTGEVRTLYRSEHGACCGVATFHPRHMQAAFILGPEHPDAHWQYGPARRRGVLVDAAHPGTAIALDGRDLTPPFTPGALRGGTHVHVFSADGLWISFTYEDHILELLYAKQGRSAANPRNIGVSVAGQPVSVPRTHPRNHDGEYFSVLVTETTDRPRPGSDEISRACEEAWIGINGYMRPDGVWQRRALAFQGTVAGATGRSLVEAFVVDLPDDLTQPGKRPLEGTPEMLPVPPRGVVQRRLTYTADRPFPGLRGPRHWLRSSPDGSQIALLMRDDCGVVQLWTVSPCGGPPRQVTHDPWDVASAFTWSPDGRWVAYVADGSVMAAEATSGRSLRLTPREPPDRAPRPEACVFSPDGRRIAYARTVEMPMGKFNQIFVLDVADALPRGADP